jgi:hypothetical protein
MMATPRIPESWRLPLPICLDGQPIGYEQIIGENTPLDAIVQQVMNDTGLTREQTLPGHKAQPY